MVDEYLDGVQIRAAAVVYEPREVAVIFSIDTERLAILKIVDFN